MIQIYQNYFLKSSQRWYGSNNSVQGLQDDEDLKHRSCVCTEWKRENGITTMNCPSQLPNFIVEEMKS